MTRWDIGFIDTTSYLTRINIGTPGTAQLTLSSGFVVGQLKKIQMINDDAGGAVEAVVAGTHFLAGLTQNIVFTVNGDTAELMWTRNGWRIISTSNAAGDAATPVVNNP